jgi:hypothetical protein
VEISWYNKDVNKALQSPWFSVVLAIVVMTVGYTVYLNKNDKLASANNYHCPIEETCKKIGCDNAEGCSKDKCNGCPYCLNQAS